MTDQQENGQDDGVDPLVSAEYRRLADETAPDQLNRAVLLSSRKKLGKRPIADWPSRWFRPVASAAVIALSLAMILEFNDAGISDSPFSAGDEAIPAEESTDVFREAADNAAQQLREAETAASRAAQNFTPDVPAAPASGENVDQTTLLPEVGGCDSVQRSTTAMWWQCIESLEARGASIQAEQELAALLRSYPAFVTPSQ